MSIYTISIDDNVVTDQINKILGEIAGRELRNKYSQTGDVIAGAVKELIYSRKDEIIEMVVDRASRELVRKGMPKLIERWETVNGN